VDRPLGWASLDDDGAGIRTPRGRSGRRVERPPSGCFRASVAIVAAVTVVGGAACGSDSGSSDTSAETTAPPAERGDAGRVPSVDTLRAIAAELRDACMAEGAVVGIRAASGATSVETAGRLAPDAPIRADSPYFAGSVTKLLVAAGALVLVERGRLELDDPVSAYLDWPRGDEITVEMLLAHRSGMGNFGNDFSDELRDLVLADLERVYSYDEVLELVAAVPPVAEPGSGYHYTNANYIVLGAIVQSITGTTLGDAMHEEIIEPLGLRDTFYGPDDLERLEATPYHGLFDVTGSGEPIDIGGFPRAAAFTIDPAGAGLVSTAPDTLVLLNALFGTDELLTPSSRDFLVEHVGTITNEDVLVDGPFAVHGHGGASPGAQVMATHDAVTGASTVAWCNRLDPGEQEFLPTVLATRAIYRALDDGAPATTGRGIPPTPRLTMGKQESRHATWTVL
jgi:CubicO group peptidase (beta-lactamase class C family)